MGIAIIQGGWAAQLSHCLTFSRPAGALIPATELVSCLLFSSPRCAWQVKKHWVGAHYWRPGPEGNDIHKTNVPNLRMRFRYDTLHQELDMVLKGAQAHEARQAALAAYAEHHD